MLTRSDDRIPPWGVPVTAAKLESTVLICVGG